MASQGFGAELGSLLSSVVAAAGIYADVCWHMLTYELGSLLSSAVAAAGIATSV